MDMVLITASIMATSLTDIGHMAITDTGPTEISVGAVVITGVAVTAEALVGEDIMAGAADTATTDTYISGDVFIKYALKYLVKLLLGWNVSSCS